MTTILRYVGAVVQVIFGLMIVGIVAFMLLFSCWWNDPNIPERLAEKENDR